MRRASALAALLLTAAAPHGDAGDAQARLEALNAREAQLTRELGGARVELVRLLAALEAMRRDPPPALLVSPGRARDAARAAILLRAIQPELQARARRFAARTRELGRVRRAAAEAGAAVFAQESASAERLGDRSNDPDRPGAPGALPATPPEAPPDAAPPARLLPPVEGAPTRRFGAPWPGRGKAEGWTWTPPAQAPVTAPAAGRVEYVGALKSWRLVVILRLDGGWRVVLAGLSRVTTPVGSTLRAGDRLGRMGSPAGGELYLELRRGTSPADPGPALAAGAR